MKPIHTLAVAAALALAAVFGVAAASRTAGIGAAQQTAAAPATIAARQHRLDRLEASLKKALADRPPALPKRAAAPAPRLVYHRPAPVVVVRHRAGGEHESEHEYEAGDD